MTATAEEASKTGALSLEQCLNSFDERLIQCNQYFHELEQ